MLSPELSEEFAEKIRKGPDLNKLPPDHKAATLARLKWLVAANRHQVPPSGDWWDIWLLLAGRGAGKTRCAAEWVWWEAWTHPSTRSLVSAPTSGDVRDVCFEGESGLLNVIPNILIKSYTKSLHEITLTNGSIIKGIPASEPDRFRGPQFHRGWLDELAAWDYLDDAWDMLQFGMRLGKHTSRVTSRHQLCSLPATPSHTAATIGIGGFRLLTALVMPPPCQQ
jgi:phage terminase large subunit-like protein